MEKLNLQNLIDEFGEEKTRAYLREFFSKRENIAYFAGLFPNHIKDKLGEYQHAMIDNLDNKRLLVAAPRGAGKSTWTDIILLLWHIIHCHSHFAVLVSDTLTQASLHLDAIREEIESNDFLIWVYGDMKGKKFGSEFMELKTPFGEAAITARGAGQKIRGLKWRSYRPQLVVIDDLENDEAVASYDRRVKLENWFRYNLLRGLDPYNNKVIYIGTVLHDKALLKRIMDGEEGFDAWETLRFNAIRDDGTSFWEDRFPIEYLKAIRDDPKHIDYCGSLVFAQEYMHEPASEEDRIIKGHWIDFYSLSQRNNALNTTTPVGNVLSWLKDCKILGGVDPAISDNKGSSDFAFITAALDQEGIYWILDIVAGKYSATQQVKELMKSYIKWKHDIIGIESIAYQKFLAQILRVEAAKAGSYPKVKSLMTDKSKERRMTLHSSKFEGGFVKINKDLDNSNKLSNQLKSFPAEPNDIADAVMLMFEAGEVKQSKAHRKKPKAFR